MVNFVKWFSRSLSIINKGKLLFNENLNKNIISKEIKKARLNASTSPNQRLSPFAKEHSQPILDSCPKKTKNRSSILL